MWITSYLGYLQQYYDLTFYDSQRLANIHLTINSDENVGKEFDSGGIATAVAHLLKNEKEPRHYLAFGAGGTIAWKAALKGLPVESLYAISSAWVRLESQRPVVDVKLLYGEYDEFKPSQEWMDRIGTRNEIVRNFGHDLYTDEKIIIKVCQDLLVTVSVKDTVI
ncbi:hypothetical protein [Arenibacter certesii]|uniref:Alpha/beta hydrolase n=1 Tax=Arenibacter certesii TaxID=228955 RepID=A0A918J2U4_9FLAO|nr:hypothetical protein [Arenibacter certesii]GGW40156.1 hypothetical protein GCM10007383_26190 [Arenibacter certesii]